MNFNKILSGSSPSWYASILILVLGTGDLLLIFFSLCLIVHDDVEITWN